MIRIRNYYGPIKCLHIAFVSVIQDYGCVYTDPKKILLIRNNALKINRFSFEELWGCQVVWLRVSSSGEVRIGSESGHLLDLLVPYLLHPTLSTL